MPPSSPCQLWINNNSSSNFEGRAHLVFWVRRRVCSHRDSWELRSMEGAQDWGEEKAPPCLLTAAGALVLLSFPPHKNPVGTGACWESGHKTEADGLRLLLICWCHQLHNCCFTHDPVGQEVVEVRVLISPSLLGLTRFSVGIWTPLPVQFLQIGRVALACAPQSQTWLGTCVNLHIFNQGRWKRHLSFPPSSFTCHRRRPVRIRLQVIC